MINEIKRIFELLQNPDFNISIEEIRQKYGDTYLKSQDEINKLTYEFYKNSKFIPKMTCMYPNCKGNAINSHSIQKALLTRLADETNHIIMFIKEFSHKNRPSAKAERIGIEKDATTFPGLCNFHDSQLFEEIEKKVIDIEDLYHHFLVSYRAVLKENYSKKSSHQRFKNLTEYALSNPTTDEFVISIMIAITRSYFLGMSYTNDVKTLLDTSLLDKNYDSELLFGGRITPKFLPLYLSSMFTPSYDFDGVNINNFNNPNESPNYFILSILPANSQTYVFYSMLKKQESKLGNIFQKLESLNDEDFLHYLSELFLKYAENFVLSPYYWDKFSEDKKSLMLKFFNDTTHNPKIKYN